ncbi:MAG: hypothetical protein L0K44_00260 [Yaniella sp.]|nr:hypothetical protein [Yaniella sp.]
MTATRRGTLGGGKRTPGPGECYLRDLEVGDAYTVGRSSPVTYQVAGVDTVQSRRTYWINVLCGAGGRAYRRTFVETGLVVIPIPVELLGPRLAASAILFFASGIGTQTISMPEDFRPATG